MEIPKLVEQKKVALFIFLVLALAGLVWFGYSGHRSTILQLEAVELTLTAQGFSPAQVTVQPGQTVVFINNTQRPFWPASDLHPTHERYPEFDPKKPVSPGQSWSFRFDLEGEWFFHDHLYPSLRGVVRVSKDQENFSYHCEAGAEHTAVCWQQKIDAALEADNLEAAFSILAELYDTEPAFATGCHGFAHALGDKAYRLFSQGKEFKLTPKTSYCGYGFYHGFMEVLLHDSGDVDLAREFCADAGSLLSEYTSDAEGACYHGIGHGSVDGTDPTSWGDPQAMIDPGISLCEQVSANESHLYRCVTGAYNAIEILSRDPKYGLGMMQKDPFYLCPSQPDKWKEGCYSNMIPALLSYTGSDYLKSLSLISVIQEKSGSYDIRKMVVLGTMFEYIREHLTEPDGGTGSGLLICRKQQDPLRVACVEGLSGGFMKYGKPGEEYIRAMEFCGSDSLREDEREGCHAYYLTRLRIWYSQEQTEKVCALAPKVYQRYCPL